MSSGPIIVPTSSSAILGFYERMYLTSPPTPSGDAQIIDAMVRSQCFDKANKPASPISTPLKRRAPLAEIPVKGKSPDRRRGSPQKIRIISEPLPKNREIPISSGPTPRGATLVRKSSKILATS